MRYTLLTLPVLAFSAIATPMFANHDDIPPWLRGHNWISASRIRGAKRSPCPLLNTLSNHGFIARNGQGITAANFTAAFISVLNLDVESANTITTGMLGKLGAPLNETATFSLDVFAAHNNTEHDASLSRVDILQGGVEGTIRVDRRLVDALIRDVQVTEQPGVNTRSLGHTRGRRERESTQAGSPPLSEFFTSAGQGEAALLAILFGTGEGEGRVAPTGQVKTWLLEERFPVELGYRRSADVLTIAVVGELGASNRRFQDAERNQTLPDADAGTTAGVGKGAGHVRGNDVFGVIEGIH